MFYSLVRFLSKLGLPIFFRSIEINGKENIPKDSGFIIALNHQNAFLDAILGALHIPKKLYFLTRSDVFVKPWSYILNAVNMLPIYRMRDGYDKLAKNDEIFDKCFETINKKGGVLIFSEANSDKQHFLRPLSKGTVRMAIQAQERSKAPIYLLPAGLNYGHHNESGHKFVLNYGKPISIMEYMSQYEAQGPRTLNLMKKDLTLAMKNLMWLPDESEDYHTKESYIKRYGDSMTFKELKSKLSNSNIEPKTIKGPQSKVWRRICDIPNLPVIGLIKLVLSKIEDPQFILSIKFLGGLFLLPIYWLIVACLVYSYWGVSIAVLVVSVMFLLLVLRKY